MSLKGCGCSGSDHTNKALLDMNDSSGENIRATPSKTHLKLSTKLYLLILLELEKFPDSPADHNQDVKEMFVCFGGEGGVQFLPQAKLSRSPQQLGNRTQAPYYFLRSCCFYLQTNRNLFRTFTAERCHGCSDPPRRYSSSCFCTFIYSTTNNSLNGCCSKFVIIEILTFKL